MLNEVIELLKECGYYDNSAQAIFDIHKFNRKLIIIVMNYLLNKSGINFLK